MFQYNRLQPIRIVFLCALLGASVLFMRPAPLFAGGVVGNGTPGSCTEAAFDAALGSSGISITFNCGAGKKTITFTNTKTIGGTTTIDGANKIILSAPGHSHFRVNSSVTLNLKNITLKNGSGTNAGALENFGTTKLTAVKFIDNTASVHGGALTNHGTLNALSVQFKGNKAGTAGGAIYNDGGYAYLYVMKFQNNQATSVGGAIDNNAGGMLVGFATFTKNKALDGGAIYNTGDGSTSQTLVAYICNFTNNQAGYGGAIENNGKLEALGLTMTKNSATGDGGAIWNLNGSLSLDAAALDQNTAGTTGGGVSLYPGTTGEIEEVSFTNNHAGEEGGGVYLEGDTKLYNSTFSANSSSTSGGGVYASFGALTAYNNTIAENTAPAGAGLDVESPATLDLQNTVLANNHGGDCGGTVPSNGANVASDNTCTGFTKPGDLTHANAFLNPPSKNGGFGLTYLPQPASPLIDAGTTLSDIDIDERLVTRPVNGAPDIGAVEVCTSKPTAPTLYSPVNGDSVSSGPIEFQWNPPTSCGAFYQLTLRGGSKRGPVIVQQDYLGFSTYLRTKPLTPGVKYYWRIKACDEVDCTASKWWHFDVGSGAPAGIESDLPHNPAAWIQRLIHK